MGRDRDLDFLQTLAEAEFSELVLIPLFDAMGYENIRYLHGPLERGKDIAFTYSNPMEGDVHYCATVKMHPITGAASQSRSIHEVLFQIRQALNEPFVDPHYGRSVEISKTYVVTPFEIRQEAIQSVHTDLSAQKHRIAFFDGPSILRLIREHLPTLFKGIQTPERRFIRALTQRLASGRTSQSLTPRRLSIIDIYTGGTLSRTTQEDASLVSFGRPKTPGEFLDFAEAFSKDPFMMVSADVGAGKTTALQKLALDLLAEVESGNSPAVPLLIPLHRLPPSSFNSSSQLESALTAYLRAEEGYDSFKIKKKKGNRQVLLLDGFDEISGDHQRAAGLLCSLSDIFRNGVLVTSRPSRIPDLGAKFQYYSLNSFTDQDVAIFLGKWFRDKREVAEAVYSKIKSDYSLQIFCRTPLMLTLYAALAERMSPEELPVRRTGVYSTITDLLLGEWDHVRGIKNEFSVDNKRFVLEDVAFAAQSENLRSFPQWNLHVAIVEVFEVKYRRKPSWAEEEAFLNEIVYRSSLLRSSGENQFEFSHLSFQEFFAARRLFRMADFQLLQESLFDDWWRGVWTFYFGLKRSLDEIHFPPHRRIRGKGETLIAFLAEADFTSPEMRESVLVLVAKDIVGSPDLSEGAIAYYSEFGMKLLDLLAREVRGREFSGNFFNYARVAIKVGIPKALALIKKDERQLSRLAPHKTVALMRSSVAFLVEDEGADLLFSFCDALVSYIDRRPDRSFQGVWQAAMEISESIPGYRFERRLPASISKRFQQALYRVGKFSWRDWDPPFDHKGLSHWHRSV